MHLAKKESSANKPFSKALFLPIKMCTDLTTDVIWINTKLFSVTSKVCHNSKRSLRVLRSPQH